MHQQQQQVGSPQGPSQALKVTLTILLGLSSTTVATNIVAMIELIFYNFNENNSNKTDFTTPQHPKDIIS